MFLALLRGGPTNGSGLVRRTGVPQKRIYQVLARLAELRLVTKEDQHGGDYRAAGVSAVRALADLRRSEILQGADALERSTVRALPLLESWAHPQAQDSPLDFVELIAGLEEYRLAHAALMRDVVTEVLSFTKPPFLLPADPVLNGLAVLERGVRIRCLYELGQQGPVSEQHRATLRGGLTEFAEAGEESRVLPELPMKMLVFDRAAVLVILPNPTTGELPPAGLLVRHPAFAGALSRLFDAYWATAPPLTARRRRDLLATL